MKQQIIPQHRKQSSQRLKRMKYKLKMYKIRQLHKKELDDFIKLSKEAGLVTTYEFSDKATVVYVDKSVVFTNGSIQKRFYGENCHAKAYYYGL